MAGGEQVASKDITTTVYDGVSATYRDGKSKGGALNSGTCKVTAIGNKRLVKRVAVDRCTVTELMGE